MAIGETAVHGWLLFGCRTSFTPEVAEIIWRRGETIAALVDNLPSRDPVEWTFAPIISVEDMAALPSGHPVAVPPMTPGHRYAIARELLQAGRTHFPPLVDPSAIVARTSRIGDGCVIGAGVVIAAMTTIGEFALVNRSASIGHHVSVQPFATLGPGCVLAGHVQVGRGAFVGAGAVCAPKVTIGANSTVGAGAVVVADVPDGTVVVGNPARVLRTSRGYADAEVPQ